MYLVMCLKDDRMLSASPWISLAASPDQEILIFLLLHVIKGSVSEGAIPKECRFSTRPNSICGLC